MEKKIDERVDREIQSGLNEISILTPGSEEKAAMLDELNKLYQLKGEQIKAAQLSEQGKDRYIKWGLEAAGIVLPLIFYAAWMRRGFKFEETGTYTSATFRGLFNRFRPTK